MLVLFCVAPLWILFYIPFKGKERPEKTKLMTTKLRAVLVSAEVRLRLRTVLVRAESDSAQC